MNSACSVPAARSSWPCSAGLARRGHPGPARHPERLTDILTVLARRQATTTDERPAPNPAGSSTSCVSVAPACSASLRARRTTVPSIPPRCSSSPSARRCDGARPPTRSPGCCQPPMPRSEWCRRYGDVDGDGFVESVPHPSGLTNLGWKDSGDSMVDVEGTTLIGAMALPEVQAYWYRAARTIADIEQYLGIGDGAAALAEAGGWPRRRRVVHLRECRRTVRRPGPRRRQALLAVRASNAGHVLWSGVLSPEVAVPVARQLADPDLFSGWGVRTLSSAAAGYNPFGYHRGCVWPHDTGSRSTVQPVTASATSCGSSPTASSPSGPNRAGSSPSSSAGSIGPICRCRCRTRRHAGRRRGRRVPR